MSAQLTLRTVTVQNKDPQLKLTTETIAVPDGITLYHGQPITEAIPLSNRQQAPAKPVFAVHADDQVTPVETAYDLFEKLLITEGDYATPSEMLDEWICWWFNTFTDIKLVDYDSDRLLNRDTKIAAVNDAYSEWVGRPRAECYTELKLETETWLVGAFEGRRDNYAY